MNKTVSNVRHGSAKSENISAVRKNFTGAIRKIKIENHSNGPGRKQLFREFTFNPGKGKKA